MTDDIVDLVRGAAEAQDYSGVDNSVGDILDAAADEIERLRADRDRWRKIADDFADAGTHPTAHDIVMEDYEEACSG